MNLGIFKTLAALLLVHFVTFACAKEPPVVVAHGEMDNLYSKADLEGEARPLDAFAEAVQPLLETARENGATSAEFEIGQKFLTIWVPSKSDGSALYQYKIIEHYDLMRKSDKDGYKTQYLERNKSAKALWMERSFIEVNAANVRLLRPSAKDLVALYEVKTVQTTIYTVGEDVIPGIDARVLAELRNNRALTLGDKIQIELTRTSARYKRLRSDGSAEVIAEAKVQYVDLTRSIDDDGEATYNFEKNPSLRPWDQRQYVMIDADATNVDSGETLLVEKKELSGCRSVKEIPDQGIVEVLVSKSFGLELDSRVCVDIDQTILSVCKNDCSDSNNLLLTFPITAHADIEAIEKDSMGQPKRKLWHDRKYVKIDTTNPQATENLVASNALSKTALIGEYVYVATVIGAHSENGSFFEGLMLTHDQRLFFEISDTALTAYKVHDALNTAGTKTPVLRYAADHFTIDRKRNAYGDSTNLIIENRDIPWQQRNHVRVNFAKNTIAGYFNHFLGINNLYTNEYIVSDSRLLSDVQMHGKTLSFDTEEVLTPNASRGNMGSGETILQPTSIVIRHTFVRVDDRVAEPVVYDDYDFKRFGVFRVAQPSLDERGQATDAAMRQYARIFHLKPNKNIVFHLNEGFPARYRKEAEAAVAAWNKALKAATGRDNVIVLKEHEGHHYADPLVNTIAYIDHRNTSAPLGYGPSIADPKTGEIIAAKTYLYGDALRYTRQVVGDYYDYLIENKREDFTREGRDNLPQRQSRQGQPQVATEINFVADEFLKVETVKDAFQQTRNLLTVPLTHQLKNSSHPSAQMLLDHDIGKALASMEKQDHVQKNASASRLLSDHNHGCMYEADAHLVSAARFIAMHKAKDLSREEIINIVESRSVFTTLLHELGHNLGLRHNFAGSFDLDNFHDEYFVLQKELEDNTTAETFERNLDIYKTSSIMDYNDLFEATHGAAGPYDVAAIKYIYGGKIEVNRDANSPESREYQDISRDDFLIALEEYLKTNPNRSRLEAEQIVAKTLGVRSYRFCTDDHVDSDPTCNRHDSGTTLTEIVSNLVSSYDINYIMNSFRRGRRSFNGSSSGSLSRYIMPVRQILDEFVYRIVTGTMHQNGPEGRRDFNTALSQGLQFYSKILNTFEPGLYAENPESGKLEPIVTPNKDQKPVVIPVGIGKYLESQVEVIGDRQRAVRRGIDSDKTGVLLAMSMRGFPAEKYRRAGLQVNYFDVARDVTLELFSNVIKGSQDVTTYALENDSAYLVIPPELVGPAKNRGMELKKFRIAASSNSLVKTYATVFALMNVNSSGDRTFGDYIDFRIKGIDDASLASTVKSIEFTSASGLRTYVVPNTPDGKSISYAIAKEAPELSRQLISNRQEIPAMVNDLKVVAEKQFAHMIEAFNALAPLTNLKPLDQDTIDEFSKDKVEAIVNLLEPIQELYDEISATEAELRSQNDFESADALKAILGILDTALNGFSCPQIENDPTPEDDTETGKICSPEAFNATGEKLQLLRNNSDQLERQLRFIESELVRLKHMYGVFQ
jgi:hypothetical protein